jgi:soluble lytic murein transglycosylase
MPPVKLFEPNLANNYKPGGKHRAPAFSRQLLFAGGFRNGFCKRFAVFGAFFCFFFIACHAGLGGMPYGKFLSMIEDADWDALLQIDISLIERTARNNPNAAFYAAYLFEEESPPVDPDSETGAGDAARANEIVVKLYKTALRDEVVRDAAANRLRPHVLKSRKTAMEIAGISPSTPALRTLKAASILTLGYYDKVPALYRDEALFDGAGELSAWDRAILLLARLRQDSDDMKNDPGEEALDFFLAGDTGQARRWLWDEITRRGLEPFSEAGANAVLGRFYTADYAYRDALAMFRASFERDERLYFRYTGLFNDLGRAYFYGGSQAEGAALFLDWEAEAAAENSEALRDFRYLCMYYAGRMRRATGKRELAAEHFTRAVELAPDSLQQDACIWYLVEMGFGQKIGTGIELLEKWADRWHDGDYFADLYDRVAQWAASTNNWNTLLDLFPTIERGNSGLTRAKYAYLIGRALEAGFIPSDDGRLSDRTPQSFFAIAYNENAAPYYYNETHLYYRALAGLKLGKEPEFIEKPQQTEPYTMLTGEGRFLEGFFTYGAAKYASAWIRDYTDTLPLGELRELGRQLSGNNLWGEAIRLCTVYMKRPDFVLTAEDIALYFPCGYAELVTRFAKEYRIDRAVLFGLIRSESIFIPDIISRAGAGGLAQLMPQTALETARIIARQGGPDYVADDAVDRANPETNVHIGAHFLRSLMDTQATPLYALLSYNGGPTRVRRWARASSLPPDLFMESIELRETREYGKKVIACAILYNSFYFSLKFDALVADIFGN